MNRRILKTLEYAKIKQAVADFLITEHGQQQLKNLVPSSDKVQVQKWLNETYDGAELLRLALTMPIVKAPQIVDELKRLKIGAVLNGGELYRLCLVLQMANDLQDFFEQARQQGVQLRTLYQYTQNLFGLPSIYERLQKSLDPTGKLLDDATPELKKIRQTIQKSQQRVRERMEQYLHNSHSKYLSESLITVRDGKLVLPVKQESRNHFGGVIHDQSASGQTVYVEPQSVIELNNLIQSQQALEKEVMQKILHELSDLLRPYVTQLADNAQLIGQLDLINAKACYAKQLKASEPLISDTNDIILKDARHPLIDPQKVVPNSITLTNSQRNVIITGPNTGGKTITLKTVGLLQLLAQSGLFIPAADNSQVAILDEIFADIGDEQSIEQNLSTFSSHIDNIIAILPQLTANSLVLLDELGAGTDPQEGAALAISLIEAISQTDCRLLVTTHYPELKLFAYNYPQTTNASMEFDLQTLQPTYRLLIGIPGSSNAFEIAQRLGLKRSIVQRAKALQAGDSQDLNMMIQDLEKQRKNFETQAHDYHALAKEAEQNKVEWQTKADKLQQNQEQIITEAKQKANQLVDQAQSEADKIINELHHLQQESAVSVKEDRLIAAKTNLKNLHYEQILKHNKVLRREKQKQIINVGDDVHVAQYSQDGVVIGKDKKGNLEVQLGIIKMKFAPEEVVKIKATPQQNEHATTKRAHDQVALKLDLRGERYEQAMADLDQYIDQALVAGYGKVTIVHGFGTGAIRKGVQQYLQQNKRVKNFAYAPANAGGQGATIVDLQ
ncbi:endonuclease MutS2 [Bombilactobacillus thymidiniphilus]|uniref:Endonuclease MutS2 n=1 Tax=Bombilactobacillus thymidiniphilus TaxID=2923363 RepID=A0ABY4PDY6_9LACO|nr:endonuclease MutS2 [Bombilactobacillus thymidiniphilus]UQS83894.1 endonuclease MutS2 [Bombilactobacillus thymidiniphilus]